MELTCLKRILPLFVSKTYYYGKKFTWSRDERSSLHAQGSKQIWFRFKGCIVFRALSAKFGLKIEGKLCFEKFSVATKFSSFYTAIASKLVERLSENVNKFGENFVSSFYRNKCV